MALQTFVVVEKSKHLKMALSIFFVEKSKHLKLRSDSDALSIVLSRLTTALSCLPACRSANAGSRPGMRHARSACIVARCTWSISAGLWGNTPTGQPCACVESHDRRQAYPTCPESTGACAVASAAKCTIENRSSCTCYSSSVRTTDSTSARLRTPSCGRPIHGVRADAIPWPSVRQGQGRHGKGKAGKKAGKFKASFNKGKAGKKASVKKGKATAGKQKTVIGLAPPPRV